MAAPITGSVSMTGVVTVTPTTLTFANPVDVDVVSGDFATVFTTCHDCADFTTPLTYAPSVDSGLLWTFTQGLFTATFSLDPGATVTTIGNFLLIAGTGTATLTGYDDTPGYFEFSTQATGLTDVTFSASTVATPVPEPATLVLFGAGLLGLGAARRARRQAQT